MSQRDKNELIVFLALAACLAVISVGACYVAYAVDVSACKSRWQDSGFEYRHGFYQGCQIKIGNGRWIPEDLYREMPNNDSSK